MEVTFEVEFTAKKVKIKSKESYERKITIYAFRLGKLENRGKKQVFQKFRERKFSNFEKRI